MKSIRLRPVTTILLLLLALTGLSARAQLLGTNGFVSTLSGWVTSNDTNNLCFTTNDVLEVSSGMVNNNNQNILAYMDVRANPYQGLAVGARIYNNSVLGTVTGAGGYLGYAVVDYSIRVTPELEIGYNTQVKALELSPGLMAEKAMTQNTFTQLGLFMPINVHGQNTYVPSVIIGLGFKF